MEQPDATQPAPDAPRLPFLWAAGVSVLATLLLAYPALGGAFLVNPNSDQYIAGYAFREFAAQSLRAGNGFPQWNPYQFGGMPYVAAMHGDIFYPTFLLRLLFPTDVAMTWGFVLHMMLAGFFTFGFLRAAGVRFHPALVGAVAYLMSGAVASYASPGHDGKLFVSTLLPAALWCLVRGVRDGRQGAFGLLAVVIGLAVLSPHPQLLQYLLLTAAAFALWLVLRPAGLPSERPIASPATSGTTSVQRMALALGAVLLGGLIGAIQYFPVREYVAWSPRAGGKGYDYATSFSFPLEETINMYLPQFSGILENYWGRNGIHFHSEYVGASVLVLALMAFGGGLANRQRRHAWFWLGTLIVSLFWAWGGNTPFYHLVYAIVPGSKFFRAPSTILYVSAFAFAVLAALGAERALAARTTWRYVIAWMVAAVGIALLATGGGFTNLAFSLADVRADAVEGNAGAVVMGGWRSLLFVGLTVATLRLIAMGRVPATVGGWVLAGLVAADLWSVERHYWRFSEPAATLYAEDDVVRYLKAQKTPGRVLALPLGDNLAPHDPFVLGDALMAHGVRGVLGYHGNEIGRFQELYGKNEGFQPVANPNFWALTNTRFFYTNTPELPFPGAKRVVGPVRNAAGSMTYLFELAGEHPAAWVAPLKVKLDDATTRATILNPNFDVRRVAIFDTSAAIEAQPVNSALPEPVPFGVTVSRYEPGAIDLTLDAPAPAGSALIVSENFYPGWRATVDGREVSPARADLTLIGVELPAGARTVTLRFDSAPYETGKLVTLLALGAACLWWMIGWVMDRRRLATSGT